MKVMHMLMVAGSVLVVLGYVCRLNLLRYGVHRLPVIALAVAMQSAASWSGVSAWQATAGLPEGIALAIAALVLASSWPHWRRGETPITAYRTPPGDPLQPIDLTHVRGSGRE